MCCAIASLKPSTSLSSDAASSAASSAKVAPRRQETPTHKEVPSPAVPMFGFRFLCLHMFSYLFECVLMCSYLFPLLSYSFQCVVMLLQIVVCVLISCCLFLCVPVVSYVFSDTPQCCYAQIFYGTHPNIPLSSEHLHLIRECAKHPQRIPF